MGAEQLLAAGRAFQIWDRGDGTVVRRSQGGQDQSGEARLMTYLGECGYPVPAVVGVDQGGRDLVMERLDGRTMAEAVERAPWRAGGYGAVLAQLHNRLHAIPPPDWLASSVGTKPAPGDGAALVHLDLHPLNVMMTGRGPVVIDWTNATVGRPGLDLARTWVLTACGELDAPALVQAVARPLRAWLLRRFLAAVDRGEAIACLAPAVAHTLADPHIREGERTAMRRLVARHGLAST